MHACIQSTNNTTHRRRRYHRHHRLHRRTASIHLLLPIINYMECWTPNIRHVILCSTNFVLPFTLTFCRPKYFHYYEFNSTAAAAAARTKIKFVPSCFWQQFIRIYIFFGSTFKLILYNFIDAVQNPSSTLPPLRIQFFPLNSFLFISSLFFFNDKTTSHYITLIVVGRRWHAGFSDEQIRNYTLSMYLFSVYFIIYMKY